MKLQAEIGDKKHDVELKRDGRKLTAAVDGREYELEVSQPESNVFLFKHANNIYEVVVSTASPGQPTHVRIGSAEFDINLIDPKRLRGTGTDTDAGDGVAVIKTAMPGKIVRVLVEAGAEVARGESVMVVEAMKMQNELKSPKAGTVKEIRVEEGSTVLAGDILATID